MKVDVLADLESLLYHYDEVQLPNLGVISTRQNDFSVDRGQGLIYPSAKKVHSFDRIINTNNNALINFIAHKYGMSYDDARQTIQDFADEYAEVLTTKGLSIPSVGDLSMDENGLVMFKPNQLRNYSIENYGLPTLNNIHPILFEKPKSEEKITSNPNPTSPVTKAVTATKRLAVLPSKTYSTIFLENRLLQMMVIIAILLVTSIPLTKRYIDSNSNQANVIIAPPTANNIDNSNTNTYDKDLSDKDGYKVTPSKIKEKTPVTPPVEEEIKPKEEIPKPPKEEIPVVSSNAHIIALGTFGSKENAERLQLNIYSKGYKDANITKLSNGYYRVAILLDCPKSEVNSKLKEIKKDFKSAYWKR